MLAVALLGECCLLRLKLLIFSDFLELFKAGSVTDGLFGCGRYKSCLLTGLYGELNNFARGDEEFSIFDSMFTFRDRFE